MDPIPTRRMKRPDSQFSRAYIERCITAQHFDELAVRWQGEGMRKHRNHPGWQDLNSQAGDATQQLLIWLRQAFDEIDRLTRLEESP